MSTLHVVLAAWIAASLPLGILIGKTIRRFS